MRKWIKKVLGVIVTSNVRVATWLFTWSGFKLSSILKDKHIECVSRWVIKSTSVCQHSIMFSFRACLMGLSTGCITFATLYLGQRHFTRQLKGTRMSVIALSSTFFACVTGNRASLNLNVVTHQLFQLNISRILDCWCQTDRLQQKFKEAGFLSEVEI